MTFLDACRRPAANAPIAAALQSSTPTRGIRSPWPQIILLATGLLAGKAGGAVASNELQAVLDAAGPRDEIAVIVSYQGGYRPGSFRKLAFERGGEDPAAVRRYRLQKRREIVRQLRKSAATQGAAIVAMAQRMGGTEVRDLWLSNAIALRGNRELIWQLLASPAVAQVRLDQVFAAPFPMAGLLAPPEWNVAALRAPELWAQGILGEGAVVASLDSGVDVAHPELAVSYRGGTNSWYDPYGQHATPYDRLGHGTQAMGLIVGGEASGTAIGVAPGATWIAAKIFDDSGVASESAIHLAFQWSIDPDGNPNTDDAPDVVTNSWDISAENTCNSAFQADIDALRAADIAVVFAAGNFGPAPSTSVSPANNPRVVSVGSVDIANSVSVFSSRGPSACDGSLFPKVVAPGDGIQTTDLSFGGMPLYVQVSGTSFSAPEVAGVVALLRSAAQTATAAEVEAALAATARDIGVPGPDQDSGYGLVDAVAAYASVSHPVDDDSDGYSIVHDCNDHDPDVHPGAHEVRRDGIDQDCNGYDMTIKVQYAVYSHDGSKLALRVTSALREDAALEIVGVGPLTWRAVRRDWIFDAGTGEEALATLTIRGVEGEVTAAPRPPTPKRSVAGP
jgi:bacillopeptidase F